MTNKRFLTGMPAVALVFVLVLAGCEQPSDEDTTLPSDTKTFTGTANSKTYTLTITDNTAYELTVLPDDKKSGGAVTASAGGVYTLKPFNSGTVFTVTVSGSGISQIAGTITFNDNTIDNSAAGTPITVTPVPPAASPATYTVAANGNATTTTTALTFTFSAAVSGLSANNIAISGSGVSVIKGALTGSGTVWTLALTVITAGNITVSVAKDGIESGQKTVAVYRQDQTAPSTRYTVTFSANGGDGSAPASQTVNAGTAITLPGQGSMIAPSGKTFTGWESGGAIYQAGASYTPTVSVILYALWNDITPPANVSGLAGTPGDGQVTINWIDPADGDLDHIEITWNGGGSVTVAKSGAEDRANSAIITGLTSETAYTFNVKAVDSAGNKSGGVTSASLTPLFAPTGIVRIEFTGLPQDENITLTGVNTLSWNANTTLTVSANGNFTAFRWVLDGIILTEQTGGSLSLNAGTLTVKQHTLTVFVTRNENGAAVEYSKRVTFTVTQ
jgi:hypothetical protein